MHATEQTLKLVYFHRHRHAPIGLNNDSLSMCVCVCALAPGYPRPSSSWASRALQTSAQANHTALAHCHGANVVASF
eukprot:355667-Amphidinium_carterae.2